MLVWTLLHRAGLDLAGWEIATLALAVLATVLLRRPQGPPPGRTVLAALVALPVWILLTLVPLPHGKAAISLTPAATFAGWLHLAACILVFLTVREVAWRASGRRPPWIAALPLVVVAGFEAALGLVQFYTGATDGSGAHGTFANRDHFAGLLEMALPFAVLYPLAALGRGGTPRWRALIAPGALAASALILAGSVHSLSRMGFLCALGGLVVGVAVGMRKTRWLLAAPAAAVLMFVFLPNDQMIARFGEFTASGRAQQPGRVEVWRETLPMVPNTLLTGCGLGAWESAFMRYKRSSPTLTDSYVHNDYLQYLVELGLPGFLCGLLLVGAAMRAAVWAAFRHASPEGRALAAACLASMAALLLHSLVDFNSYIPSNALVFAWVAGLAASRF